MKHLNASCKNGFLTHNTIGGTSQTFDIDDENFSPVDIAKVMDALTAMTRTLWPQDPSFPAGDQERAQAPCFSNGVSEQR